jgi:cyclase
MLRPRLIPCLLLKNNGLVKTVNFKNPKYVGDPINAVRIFNEKSVDELVVLDIDSSVLGREPDYALIEKLAAECRMPLCYGGGVKTVEQAERIFSLGVEKVAISAAAVADPDLITRISRNVGNQSLVVVIDAKFNNKNGVYEVWVHNGTKNTGIEMVEFAKQIEKLGAGEIVINSIDNDGVMMGYDMKLVNLVRDAISIPMSALGGAGSKADIAKLINKFGIIGAMAGSMFVFKGVYKAVLISYLNKEDKADLMREHTQS